MIITKNYNIENLIQLHMCRCKCNSYWMEMVNSNENMYTIYDDNLNFIGIVDIVLQSDDSAYIEMIEILYKNKGIGKFVIAEIFNSFSIKSISGNSLYKTINFWKSIGAEFDDFDINEIGEDEMISFTLIENKFLKEAF